MLYRATYRSTGNILSSVFNSDRIKLFPGFSRLLTTTCSNSEKHQITFKPYVPPCKQDHDHKNMKLKRPMSPHLTVYLPTIPAATSIMQRITGTLVALNALMMSFGTLFMSNGVETYVCIIQSMNLGSMSVFLLKIIIGYPFAYHYSNGIRYTLWNAAKLLDLKSVYATARTAVIASAAITFLFALL